MNYRETEEYLESLQSFGSVLGLDGIRELCKRLGNPQNNLKFIHIAGTNGKGSTLAFISTILQEAGYRTGRYISPAVREYRERFQVNQRMISRDNLCQFVERVRTICEEMVQDGLTHPTSFEVETAVAFLYFQGKKCDIVVLETGMGGSTDATNIISNTLLAVFTPVSLDHVGVLGNTLEEIATVKAGILKKGAHAVSSKQPEVVRHVISDACAQAGIPVFFTDEDIPVSVTTKLTHQTFSMTLDGKKRSGLKIALAGKYQIANAVLAVRTIDTLCKNYPEFKVDAEAIRRGLAATEWFGRFSIVGKNPLFIIDGAHNEDGAARLAESIEFYFTNKKIIYIMGILKDKEYEKIIANTCRYADSIITVRTPGNARAMDAFELAKEVSVYHKSVTVADSVEEAVEMAYLLADKESVIIAFGSLSYLGRLADIVENRNKK